MQMLHDLQYFLVLLPFVFFVYHANGCYWTNQFTRWQLKALCFTLVLSFLILDSSNVQTCWPAPTKGISHDQTWAERKNHSMTLDWWFCYMWSESAQFWWKFRPPPHIYLAVTLNLVCVCACRQIVFGGVILSTDDYFVSCQGVYQHDFRLLQHAHMWNQQRGSSAQRSFSIHTHLLVWIY